MRIFDHTKRPDPSVFFKSYDANDPRLGSVVRYQEEDYNGSTFVIIGSPQDIGVQRNRGRPGASEGPDTIRQVLYKMAYPKELEALGLFDLGNINIEGTLEEIHEVQTEVVQSVLADGKIPLVLGGGNDISYPDASAVSREFGDIAAINIDNHFDVRKHPERNSGTPYRMLLEERHLDPEYFIEFGCQLPANSHIYRDYLDDQGVKIYYLQDIQEIGLDVALENILAHFGSRDVFWGYDMDSIKAADAPGVSAITPTGLTAEDAITIAKLAGEHPFTRLFEISEFNPRYDIDQRTARLASLMITQFITSYSLTNGD